MKRDDDDAVEAAPAGGPQGSLYRAVWRWHFYAGLIIAPVMIVASATGALYVFHDELTPWLSRSTAVVEASGARLTFDDQLQRLKEQATDFSELDALNLRNDPTRSTEFITHAYPGGHANPDQKHRVYSVDPYTGKLLGTRLMEDEFFHIVLDLHRSLFAGATGRVVVELATSWGLILTLTGIYLWWPRGNGGARGVWIPRMRGALYRVLRDWHAVMGVYVAVFAAIVLSTGLFVSQIWGTGFTWASVRAGQSLGEFLTPATIAPPADAGHPASLEKVAQVALAGSRPGDGVYVMLSEKPETAHKVYVMTAGDTNTVRGLDIDPASGELHSSTDTPQLEPMVRFLALAVSLHQGKTFGLPSKIVAFLTCIVLIVLSITGVWMWWRRRPAGQAGFPKAVPARSVPGWVWGMTIVLGLLLPAAGVSMVLFVCGEAVARRLRPAA